MATRRPRVKPTAILKSRRPQSAQSLELTASNSLKAELSEELDDVVDVSSQQDSTTEAVQSNESVETKNVLQSINKAEVSETNSAETKPDIGRDVKNPAAPNVPAAKPFRRIITPTVNIVSRRKIPTENRPFNHASPVHGSNSPGHMRSPAHMKSPAYSYMYENTAAASPRKIDEKPISSPKIGATNEDEVFSPAPENDDCFKSPPFMSPSIYSRRPDMSPYPDAFSGDESKTHGTALSNGSNKIRHRIRPTPCFNRRNSIQGVSESDDDTGRRQRHYSTSSTYSSNYNPNSTPQQNQRNYFGLNKTYSRIRTESMCSNVSEAASVRDINTRPKRMHRSEEFQRVANAKREFNQRLNGKVPDKSRLTMYDMIYYNPVTNPMSRPAVKSEMKDRNDNSSVSSIRTIESRHSVKTEPKVKAENTDSNQDAMPVPQLKLGPNGEIILDEKSLVIETTGNREAREMLANSDIVYDDEFSGTSGFYKRHKRTKDWPAEETIKFYRSLQAVGTDFSVMLQLFPNRSRRDLKLKFKKEERHNMALINKALLHPKEFNVEELKLQFEEEDRDKEAQKAEWAELAQKISRDRKEQINVIKKRSTNKVVSPSARCLTVGDQLYENEFVTAPKGRKVDRATLNGMPGSEPQTVENSPMPSSPFVQPNIANTSVRSPTYATHKLPSFNEMISSHKSSSFNTAAATTANNNNNHLVVSIGENGHVAPSIAENTLSTNLIVVPNDDELPVPATSAPIVSIATASESNTITITGDVSTQSSLLNGTVIDPYIAENPNLTYKSNADDIMNMDIIFDNVPIEEDPTIGSNVTIIHETTASDLAEDNIHYEIVQLDGVDGTTSVVQHQIPQGDYSQLEDSSNDGILVIDETMQTPIEYSEIVIDSNEVVIMSSPPPSDSTQNEVTTIAPSDRTDGIEKTWSETIVDPTPEKPEPIKSKPKCNRRPKATELKSESTTAKQEILPKETNHGNESAASSSSLKRKRKPLPALIGRNKKSKTQNSQLPAKSDIEVDNERPSNESETVADNVTIEPSTSAPCVEKESDSIVVDDATDDAAVMNDSNEDASNFMDSLVVVESQDPNDPSKTIHEVYVISPDTKKMSEQPLDLPDEVIQRIRLSMMPGAE